MEDHSKSNAQRKDNSERNIVELTSDMEVQDQDGNDIIDLTNAIDTPLETPISPKPSEPSPEGIAAMQTASDPAANPALEGQPTVEAQVDAAFDRVGTLEEPKPTAEDSKEQLFDQLSGLTQQVDSVIEETTADETDSAAPERHPEDAEQETSSSNAEWLDVSCSASSGWRSGGWRSGAALSVSSAVVSSITLSTC